MIKSSTSSRITIALNMAARFLPVLFLFSLLSCNSVKPNTDFLYFTKGLDSIGKIQIKEAVIKPSDMLNIQVSSKSNNQEQAKLFNIGSLPYTVNGSGTIDIPVIGTVKAAGLTKVQLQSLLTEKLSPYVKDPLVIVSFNQFNVNILGEVQAPGTKVFKTDRVSIIDAIAASGEITEGGKKENVMVIREENDGRKYYLIDLRSGSLFQSPAYLLQPNDIVYVEPTKQKLRDLNHSNHRQQNQRYYVTFLTAIATVITLIYTITRIN